MPKRGKLMATVTLPSGDTAEITDPDDMTAGTKLAVQRAVSMVVNNGKMELSLALSEEMKVAALVTLIKSWSKDLPVTKASVEGLAIKEYNALSDAIKEHMGLLRATPDKSDAPQD
jgi:hypothetical protein